VLDRGDYLPPNCAFKLEQSQYKDEEERVEKLATEKQRIIDEKEAPDGMQPAYSKNDTIVYRRPKLTARETSELTSEAALDVIDGIQNGDIEMPEMSRDDARNYLQKLIFDQMLRGGKKFKNIRLEPKKNITAASHAREKKKVQIQPSDTSVHKSKRVDNIDLEKPVLKRHSKIDKYKKQVRVKPPSHRKKKKEPVYYLEDTETETEVPDSDSEYEYEYVYEDVEPETDIDEEAEYKARLEEQQRKELYVEEE